MQLQNALPSEDTMVWIWMGANPVGADFTLGAARLFTLAEVIKHYGAKLRRAGVRAEVAK